MNLPEQRSDEDLANLLQQGDASASATLAQRYAPGLYDFAIRITLDPAAAANVTETSLNRATAEIGMWPHTLTYRAWLYGIARDESLEGLRQRARGEPGAEDTVQTVLSPMDPRFVRIRDVDGADAAAWAWSSARGQRPRDYSILDLLLRRKITPEEVAEIASLSRNGVYAVLGRLRGGFEESFVATALYSSGRTSCADLDALLGDSISLGPAMRREVSRHAESCPICKETRSALLAAADVFAGLEDVEIPDDLSDRLLPLMLAAGPTPAPVVATEASTEEDAEADLGTAGLAGAAAMAGAAGAAAGFASNGDETSEAPSEAQDAEANAAIPEEETTAAAQASLFEADADSTESEVQLAEQPVEDDETIALVEEPDAEAEEPEALAVEEPEAEAEATAAVEEEADEDEDAGAALAAGPFAAASLAAASLAADEPDDVEADEPLAPLEQTEAEPALGGLPRPSYIQGQGEPEAPYDAYAEDTLETELETATEGNAEARSSLFDTPAADDDDIAYDEDNTPDPSILAELDEADEVEERPAYEEEYEEDDAAPAAAAPAVAIFGRPDALDTEDSTDPAASSGVFAGAAAGSAAGAAGARRGGRGLRGGGGGNPPARRGPFDGEEERPEGRSKKKFFVYAIVAGVTLVALYLGIALGDSLQGGGGGGGTSAAALPTRASGVTDVACPGPVQVNQGSRVALAFANVPTGFTLLADPAVRPTGSAQTSLVNATSQQGNTVLFIAGTAPNSAGRTDEYQVTATFANGDDRQQLQCVVRVVGTTPAPTATVPPAVSPTVAPTNTAVPATPTTAPIVQPTQVPTLAPTAIPTATPDLSTPTPDLSTPTPPPVATGVLISPTETATPAPPTATPTP